MSTAVTLSHCSIPDCDRPVGYPTYGWCTKHYQRARKSGGDPLAGGTPKGAYPALVARLIAEIPDGRCRPTPYGRDAAGYAVTSHQGRLIKVTHLVLEATNERKKETRR